MTLFSLLTAQYRSTFLWVTTHYVLELANVVDICDYSNTFLNAQKFRIFSLFFYFLINLRVSESVCSFHIRREGTVL